MTLKREMPNIMSQMLLRWKNAVGYGMYADNVIEDFIVKAADAGMDVFRVFDAFNDLDQMKLCVQTIIHKTKKIYEVCICYIGITDKFSMKYYTDKALEIKQRWPDVHLICLKDMAGLLMPTEAE